MNPFHRPAVDRAGPIYMDYQASTPLDPRVLDAMMPYLSGAFGNPHADTHVFGWEAADAIDRARRQIAALVGAEADEIVFTSGATEASNVALLGSARAAPRDRHKIVVSAVEHKCVLAAARALSSEGFEVSLVGVNRYGLVDLDDLARLVDSRTAVVSVMAVNNEVGTVQSVGEVAGICRARGALLHTDAAQALAVEKVDVGDWGVDLMSLSSHKAYGPKGVGALYVGREARGRIQPIMFGGEQEDGLRPGTLPTPLCIGFGSACAILENEREIEVERIRHLRDELLKALRAAVPDLVVHGRMGGRHAGNLNIAFPDVEADALLGALRSSLAAATGSACTSGMPEPSHVLRAMGIEAEAALRAIRLSIGRFTTELDVLNTADLFAQALLISRQQ